MDNFQTGWGGVCVTKGQFATPPQRVFDFAEGFFFITSNNLGQPWLALWKIDEEEGEWIYRGGWSETRVSALGRLRLLFAFHSKS